MKINKVIIIAEIGVNHNGKLAMAKKLIDYASMSKADYVKFQTFKTNDLVTLKAKKAYYQIKNVPSKDLSQYKLLKNLELNEKDIKILINYCKSKKIKFLSSVFDIGSFNLLIKLKQKIFKLPSSEINNLPLLRHISKFKIKIILSTGMSNLKEINQSIKILTKNIINLSDISILHCTTSYPTLFSETNLNVIKSLKDKFKCSIGYSDHTHGSEISIAAVAMGAKIIEKHFTINKKLKGPDHKMSLIPKEFKYMVECIRNVEISKGNKIKKPTNLEMKNFKNVRKSIVAKTNINKGEVYTIDNLAVKRPGNGISPMFWDKLIGRKSKQNYKIDNFIKW